MADPQVTTIAPGVTRHDCGWGYMLYGNKERMIATGLVEQSWFTDGIHRDDRGRIVRTKRLTVDGRHVKTTVRARGMCYVFIDYTEEEGALIRPPEERDEAGKHESQKVALPGTIAEHREKLLANVTDWERLAQCYLDDEDAFYRLSATDQQKLSEAWSHIRSIVLNAAIRPRRFAVIEGGRAGWM